jgi:hypothetical protein
MQLTEKHRKYLWIAAAVIAAVHFLHGSIGPFTPHQQPTPIAKPSPIRVDQAAMRPVTPVAPADPLANLIGVWSGNAVRPNNTYCRMRLELRSEKPGAYAAYTTTACGPAIPIHATTSSQRQVAAIALKQMTPVSVAFRGRAVDGVLQFDQAQTLSPSADSCMPVSLTVTPFGTNAISAQWRESGVCQGGQMLLQKTAFAPFLN